MHPVTSAENAKLDAFVELTLLIERETGFDSVPTIERIYDGVCCFPRCGYQRKDPVDMWFHVHVGPKHRASGGHVLAQYGPEIADLDPRKPARSDASAEGSS